VRALIRLLSLELFGRSLTLADFPKLRAIRGLGMTDKPGYAEILADKFDYTNTYYDREPRFDFTELHPQLAGTYDFILSSDVLEHIAPPVEHAIEEACRLLKPRGFLAVTVPCIATGMQEHFPNLHDYRVVPLGTTSVLVNRRRDGTLEVHDNLAFHGGHGAVLEMRLFAAAELRGALLASGFQEVDFMTSDVPDSGILFDPDVSQPLIARKERFALEGLARTQLIGEWAATHTAMRRLTEQVRMAEESRWLRLGRMIGLGPNFRS
jgi:SAM-dependent methyltransferase